MNKYQLYTLGGLLMAVASLGGCAGNTVPPSAQANFDSACSFLKGTAATAKPLLPLVVAKLGPNGVLAIQTGLAAIDTTCSQPLDLSNSAAVTQRVWDIAGGVVEIVVKAQSQGG